MRFEVRRLHDTYRYTTIYVTHDQSEAMTTADLIAVMNAGRIEQLGTPQQVYEQPRSEFVARFLGGSNILRGKALDATRVAFAGAASSAAAGRWCPAPTWPCRSASTNRHFRQRASAAAGSAPCGHGGAQRLSRATRDYIVEAKDGTQLRVTGDAGAEFRARHASVARAAGRRLPRAGGLVSRVRWVDLCGSRAPLSLMPKAPFDTLWGGVGGGGNPSGQRCGGSTQALLPGAKQYCFPRVFTHP